MAANRGSSGLAQKHELQKTILSVSLFAAISAGLVACGGGGSSSTPAVSLTGQSVTMQTYITDNLTTDYSKVWVPIKKIAAKDATGAEVVLLDSTSSPTVVNLSSLSAVGQLMSASAIQAGI